MHFRVSWYPSDDHIHHLLCDEGGANCVDRYETLWNPQGMVWGGSHGEFFGETKDHETDMPGTANQKTNFKNQEVKSGATEPLWFTASLEKCVHGSGDPCNEFQSNRYHFEWVANPHFRIWTDPI